MAVKDHQTLNSILLMFYVTNKIVLSNQEIKTNAYYRLIKAS